MAIKKLLMLLLVCYLFYLLIDWKNKVCFLNYKYPLKSNLFEIKNIRNDFNKHISKSDYTFLCISGLAISIPPNISLENKLVKKYGYKCICVSDIMIYKEIKDLKRIYNYTKKYNLLLLKYLNNETK